MRKKLKNALLIILLTTKIMLIISFITWDIKWITNNSFISIIGKIVSIIFGTMAYEILTTKKE